MDSKMFTNKSSKEMGVYDLLTELCSLAASKYSEHSHISQKTISTKMRSFSYEIILTKSKDKNNCSKSPISDLLSQYYICSQTAKNVAEFKQNIELKNIINIIHKLDLGEEQESFNNVLRFLIALSNSENKDYNNELFQHPFSFGLLDAMLPRPVRQSFGSPQPYPYFPSYVFELPYPLKYNVPTVDHHYSKSYTEYTVESFDSKSVLPNNIPKVARSTDFKSPISIASMSSSKLSPYLDNSTFIFPKLTAPRDLEIPCSESNSKVSLISTNVQSNLKAPVCTKSKIESFDIWDIASQVDKDIPSNIWDIVSKLPPIEERQFIASSSKNMLLWRNIYGGHLSNLDVISERQFIRHIMFLIIGIETTSFPFDEQSRCFSMKEDLILEGITKEHLQGYMSDLLLVGTYYRRLYNFAFNHSLENQYHTQGLVFEASREVIRNYLLEFRLKATEIYEDCCRKSADETNCMPTLLQILFHIDEMKYEIETISSIFKMIDSEPHKTIPRGAELMSYLFDEISSVTHKQTAITMFNSFYSVCKVYFKFIEKFIFEGELNDRYSEFFIRKDSQNVNSCSKRYWDKGFHITQSMAVPEFLKSLAKFILLCGKSLRLLKLCNPNDPLVLLISSDHPSIKCCANFDELSRQQQLLGVYRTRCLFVSGEPVTFEQILLKKEAAKKAFTEMASLKQAETMEKIIAERKRLAQLIIAEKQHSLRVLEAAMAEAKAAKSRSKKRERLLTQMEQQADKISEEVDSRLRDDEKNKIMEYYSKLNMEVEKKKILTEWKIKRLHLDQARIQLLSTEERNLKRQKLELEHQRKDEIMAMSIQSVDSQFFDQSDGKEKDLDNTNEPVIEEPVTETIYSCSDTRSEGSMFSAICNAAKSIFGVSTTTDDYDNVKDLDKQGNLISKTSSSVIGEFLDAESDNIQFLQMKQKALDNKHKVMAHEFGVDEENNKTKTSSIEITANDSENNVDINMNANDEARRNRSKILGADFDVKTTIAHKVHEPRTVAQKEALVNRQKVLGVEFNLPPEPVIFNDPANLAQVEAVKNKKKMLGDSQSLPCSPGRDVYKRSRLTLKLKPFGSNVGTSCSVGVTPVADPITPGCFFPGLDLDTPTTADVPLESQMTSDIFSPIEESKNLESAKNCNEKDFLNSTGFNFSMMVDEAESEIINSRSRDTPDSSPSKNLNKDLFETVNNHYIFNILDGTYDLKDFDPFGVKDLNIFATDILYNKMDAEMNQSCYTHPAIIMDEVKKKPYKNIFSSNCDDEKDIHVATDNIATLTACLQRSVMLPLTYQLEVVNNSILTYFLVNLDMYENLNSLKDYFFLMDGEFSRCICNNLFAKLTKTMNPQELLNFTTLHGFLDKALGASISHGHKFSENLSFTITDSPLSFQHSSPDVLQCLSLTYSVNWPLNIILSKEALLRYGKVFQFLVKMKRIFWILSEDFEMMKLSVKYSRQHSRRLLKSPQYISLQLYRHIMSSMIRALDNYIATTCIQSSWKEFECDLKKARTLDDLYECHVVYLKKVLFRCLLNNRSTPVMKLLNDIFTVVLKFSRVLKAGEWQQKTLNGNFTHSSFGQLQELYRLFEKLAKYLHKVIAKLMECGYQRHLAELLIMINLNGYYDPDGSKADPNVSNQSI